MAPAKVLTVGGFGCLGKKVRGRPDIRQPGEVHLGSRTQEARAQGEDEDMDPPHPKAAVWKDLAEEGEDKDRPRPPHRRKRNLAAY